MKPNSRITAHIATGDKLDVREFRVEERISALFRVELLVYSDNANLDLERIVGREAGLALLVDEAPMRSWEGICRDVRQLAVGEDGYTSYELTIVPLLWLATQRRNHRMFQQLTEPAIVERLLDEWKIAYEMRIDPGDYRAREYRVQYGEADYSFICRTLEHAGVTFTFDAEGALVLTDAPQSAKLWGTLEHQPEPEPSTLVRYATAVRVSRRVRPGRYVVRDRDPRLPAAYPLSAESQQGEGPEQMLERYHYLPGSFLCRTEGGTETPSADDKGRIRSDEAVASLLARRRLEAKRAGAQIVTFETNAHRLAPGSVVRIDNHPSGALARELLVVGSDLSGSAEGRWIHQCQAVAADVPYRPALLTPKPKAVGVETATVVGPPGEEIHTDELGRVRVHFHWDRDSKMDDDSSCWIQVSQPWGGAGFGGINLPRVGQEVIVDFVGGNPDYPVIVGRLYTSTQRVPYALPSGKAQSGWRSNTYPGGGGYNELMFDDSANQQLVNLQAERDMNALVKHDETAEVGNNRTRSVGNDETLTIANDRACTIGNDQTTAIGNCQTVEVAQDSASRIGNDLSIAVGNDLDETIGHNAVTTIAGSWRTVVGSSVSQDCGGSSTRSVGLSDRETVGLVKSLMVGAAYTVSVGGAMSSTVLGLSSEQVGLAKSIKAGTKITLECGASSLTLAADGTITIKGTNLVIEGSDHVQVTSALIELN